ncbi:MAG: hypothetical protein ACREDF_09900, partial [Thermoplasmata archaeon]
MIDDVDILLTAMYLFVFLFLFGLGLRVTRAFHVVAGIVAIFLGVELLRIVESIILTMVIVFMGV